MSNDDAKLMTFTPGGSFNGYRVAEDGTVNSPYPVEMLPRRLAWLDTETSDLDRRHCFVLEVGCIVTDEDFNELGVFHEIENRNVLDQAKARMDQKVLAMHTDSGLLAEIASNNNNDVGRLIHGPYASESGESPGFLALLSFLKLHIPEKGRGLLAGSSVHFDKDILREHAPFVLDHLHYRILDVSVIKEACRLWAPNLALPKVEHIAHRALDDLRASIAEMKLYRDTVFKPAAVVDMLAEPWV